MNSYVKTEVDNLRMLQFWKAKRRSEKEEMIARRDETMVEEKLMWMARLKNMMSLKMERMMQKHPKPGFSGKYKPRLFQDTPLDKEM